MFSKYEQRYFIKIQIAGGKNARQCHTALLEACGRETLPYLTVARWAYTFCRGRKDVHQNVELLMCGGGFFMLEEITSDHLNNATVPKMYSLLLIQILTLII